jgi:hypothetical protein
MLPEPLTPEKGKAKIAPTGIPLDKPPKRGGPQHAKAGANVKSEPEQK